MTTKIATDDKVRWSWQDGLVYGRVIRVTDDGSETVSGNTMDGTEDNPVYVVMEHKPNSDGEWQATGQEVLRREDALTAIDDYPQKAKHARVKSLKQKGDGRVGGYLVRFTSADDPDLHGEYFDKRTYFWEKERPIKGIPILIDHAFDSKFKGLPVGIVDFVNEDEIGIWIEGKLKERDEYLEYLQHMRTKGVIDVSDDDLPRLANNIAKAVNLFFDTGQAQWSSGAHPQLVEVDAEDGHIKSWAFIEATAVYEPAEPDGTEIRSVSKALSELDTLLTSIQTVTATKEANQEPKESDADNVERGDGQTQAVKTNHDDNSKESDDMNEEMIRQIIRMVLEESKGMYGDDDMRADMPDEDELMDAMNMDELDADKMDDDEMAKSVAEKAWTIIEARAEKQRKALDSARSAVAERSKAWRESQPTSDENYLPNAKASKRGRTPEIKMRSSFDRAGWTGADFNFAMNLASAPYNTHTVTNLKRMLADPDVQREAAGAMLEGYENGDYELNHNTVKSLHAMKADEVMNTALTGFGLEHTPEVWADSVWEKPRVDARVNTIFRNVDMPSDPYQHPTEGTDPTVRFIAESEDSAGLSLDATTPAIPRTQIGTSKVTFVSKKTGFHIPIAEELAEDGITRLIPFYRQQSETALIESIDSLIVNGDTATTLNVNSDGETITATDRNYQAYNGLIKQTFTSSNQVDNGGSAPTLTNIRSLRNQLSPAIRGNPRNLAIICDPSTYVALLNEDAVVTMDKYGSNATVLQGELGRIDNIPVFQTDQMALADADGKITNSGNTVDRGRLLLAHIPSWYFGYRRQLRSNLTYIPYYDTHVLTVTSRHVLVGRTYSDSTQQAADDTVALLYNIGV